MTKKIEFYYDFISPYSYLAHKRIQKIEKNTEIKFNYNPILLGGLHNLAKITAPGLIKAKQKYLVSDCNMIAEKYKINFKFNEKFPINSLSLMRGNIIIDEYKKREYVDKVFEAYWLDNVDFNNEKNLLGILDNLKINNKFFFEKINEQSAKNELKNLTENAFKKKIFGAPSFIVNEKIFWGQDRLEYALDEYEKKN
tara:strand:+ start:85 stop:675 length:591 start_codon:yes stop_codon:yes gene_type:complete